MMYILTAIIGYFLGNFATSYFAGRILKGIDIRQHGSGNAGTTNTIRVLGLKAGLIVFAGDIIKGVLAVLAGWLITGSLLGMILAGCSSVIGHNWPILLGFKGGKGIATSLGMILAIFPYISIILISVGIIIVIFTRYVSLASITAAILFPILLVIFREPVEALAFGILISILALYKHKTNISRLLKGQENKIAFGKKQ